MYLWNDIALIEDDAYFTRWVKKTGRLDHHQGFLQYLKPYIHGTVLDLGANIGTHTIFYAKLATKVYAFEPNPVAFKCLQHNLRGYDNVTLKPMAVGSEHTTVDLVPQGDNYGAVYTKPGTEYFVVTVDDLLLDSCEFIKIDVEGDEIEVLKGARKTIDTHRPIMCIECNTSTLERKGLTQQDLIDYITFLGYDIETKTPDISMDLLCTPKNLNHLL